MIYVGADLHQRFCTERQWTQRDRPKPAGAGGEQRQPMERGLFTPVVRGT